jgi:hypothetical protein
MQARKKQSAEAAQQMHAIMIRLGAVTAQFIWRVLHERSERRQHPIHLAVAERIFQQRLFLLRVTERVWINS